MGSRMFAVTGVADQADDSDSCASSAALRRTTFRSGFSSAEILLREGLVDDGDAGMTYRPGGSLVPSRKEIFMVSSQPGETLRKYGERLGWEARR